MLELLENPNKYKELRETYRNFKPEISKKIKVEEIIKAHNEGATKMSLDPEGQGDTIRRLLNGRNVGMAKINQVYAHLLELQGDKPELIAKSELIAKPSDLQKKVLEQEKQISYLLNKIGSLEVNVKKLAKKIEEKESKKKQKKY